MQVIPVVIVNVNVVSIVPIISPTFWPRVNQHEPKPAVLEAGIPPNDDGAAVEAEPVPAAEVEREAVLRNIVATVAAALIPGAMLDLPPSRAILLPGVRPLPSTLL